jgi:hypothetical protein
MLLRHMRRLAVVTLLLVAGGAHAAPDPVADLRARVAELERVLAELPSALEALHELENRLAALEQRVDRAGVSRAADADIRRALDALREELDETQRNLVRTQLRVSQHAAMGPVALGYDDGLYLRAPQVEAVLNAGVQPRYTATVLPPPVENRSSFELHHAQLALTGRALGWIGVRAMFDFGAEYTDLGGLAMVRDLYAEVRPLSWMSVRGGRFRIPFGRQRVTEELRQTFIDRSLATRALTFDYDQGLLVEVSFFAARLYAQAAITNGAASPTVARNDNLDLAYTARVVGQPLGALPLVEGDRARTPRPRFAVGAAFQYNLVPTDLPPPFNDVRRRGRPDNVEVIAFGAEAAFKWHGWAVEAEYFLRHERPGFGRPQRLYQGGYVQASAMAWRGLEAALRFSYSEIPGLRPPLVGALGDAPARGLEAGGVVNWYQWGENLKAQLAYAYRYDTAADPFDARVHDAHIIDVQVQAGF